MGDWKCATGLRAKRTIIISVMMAMSLMLTVSQAAAFELPLGDEVTGNLNMTLGYGISARTEDANIGAGAPNTIGEGYWKDAGDVVSHTGRISAELGLSWRNFGLVSNAAFLYDTEVMNPGTGSHDVSSLLIAPNDSFNKDTEDVSGRALTLSDAYVYGTFDIGEMPLELRVGRQVVNWGEGLYWADGVGTQVPLNLANLLVPGSDLKDAYMGLTGVRVMVAPSENLSLDGYVFFEADHHQFPGHGTFYGDDIVGPGTEQGWNEFGTAAALGTLKRDVDTDDNGQFGISGRYVLGDVELGLYYSRHHELFPALNADASGILLEEFMEGTDMYGASFSTSLGMWSFNGETAYRPDRQLYTNVGATLSQTVIGALFGSGADIGTSAHFNNTEEHDTITSSIHGIGLYGGSVLGIDANVFIYQLGHEYISGDLGNLQANTVIHDVAETADEHAFSVAGEWDATWQAVMDGVDLTSILFVQYDFSGNSHFWGNYAEGRVLSAFTLSAAIGTDLGVDLTYSRWDQTESDYEHQDTINFSVKYTF